MPTIKTNMIGTVKCPSGKGREDFWLENAVNGFPNLTLGVRVSRNGNKKWIARYRVGGGSSMRRRLTLGGYGNPKNGLLDYRAAVRKAVQMHADAQDGNDPAAVKRQQKEKRITGGNNVEWLLAEWLKRHCVKLKPNTADNYQQILKTHLMPEIGDMPFGSITKRDMIDALENIQDASSAKMAERVRIYATCLFNWAQKADLIEVPPTFNLPTYAKQIERERILSDDEIRAIWTAADNYRADSSFGDLVKLLFLTGQRRNEIATMQRADINIAKARYTIPGERNKSGRLHDVPLSPQSQRIIGPRLDDEYEHLFPASAARYAGQNSPDLIKRDKPMSGWSKMKKQLDQASGVTNWHLHDIRRTVGTNLGELGVPRFTISRILNHKEGGVTDIYDRASYFAEKRDALERWARHLDTILTPDGGENVVPLLQTTV